MDIREESISLTLLGKKLNAIEFVTKSNRVYAFYQFQAATTVYAMVAELDEKGQLVGTPIIVDTAEKIRPGSNTKVFNLIESQFIIAEKYDIQNNQKIYLK